MKYAPHLAGAVALVTLAGAVSGAAIGDSRILERDHYDTLPEAQIVTAGNAELRTGERPPDHYPLKTPEGTIEVAELALHGRMRDSSDDLWWEERGRDRVGLAGDYGEFYASADAERLAREEALLAFTGSRAEYQNRIEERRQAALAESKYQRVTRAEAPMALAEPAQISEPEAPASPREPSTGKAKTIDVTAALAARE
ncbi:MAG: hypothetical protein EX258_08890 [Sphingomonadaceae bacterium]|nr:MAG: hypothetical protein EX258_08890 [Sphingomonadaceae bacterium]